MATIEKLEDRNTVFRIVIGYILSHCVRFIGDYRLAALRRVKNVRIHSSFRAGEFFDFKVKGSISCIEIKDGVSCRRFCSFLIYEGATLSIGRNVSFNNQCSVNCLDRIEIGNNTIFGEGVRIYDHNHQYTKDDKLVVERKKYNLAPVRIGSNCWIASNVIILKGVTIGDNSIIGANCLVHKSVPANSIVRHKESLIIENYGGEDQG